MLHRPSYRPAVVTYWLVIPTGWCADAAKPVVAGEMVAVLRYWDDCTLVHSGIQALRAIGSDVFRAHWKCSTV